MPYRSLSHILQRCLSGLAMLGLALLVLPPAQAEPPPTVAAAADLKFALEEIAARFQREHGQRVQLSFGSSGNFARQIAQGAPFQLFLSADEGYVQELARQGRTAGEGVLYAEGRLALYALKDAPLAVDGELQGLAAALDDGRLTRLAIANPEHAPYGRAAREALQRAGLWERLQERLVLGENAAQAAQFVVSGNAQAGLIPYALALAPQLAERGQSALIPADRHAPLRQRMVLMPGAGATARAFYDYLQTPAARDVLRRYGFLLPGEGG
ncbi:MAG TPA: molybdate ABC transporter substrate-binding protein [Candidatus Competibacteraceae bacterium]|nr:molybdate ABC transporter substrate-binding protein [Candidatus Competibacteraceae bacterium]